MAQGLFAAGIINENSAHSFGCGVEEMDASVPLDVLHSGKAQPGLVNEGGRLQSLARSFTGHFVSCQAPELVIDQRKQFLRGIRIARSTTRQRPSQHETSNNPEIQLSRVWLLVTRPSTLVQPSQAW